MDDDRDVPPMQAPGEDAEGEATRALGPDAGGAPTRALDPDEAPTRVYDGEPTRVTGPPPQAGGPATPPPPPPGPPRVALRREGDGGRLPWWLWLVLVAVVAAAAASWVLLWPRSAPAGEELVGSWTPAGQAAGGLVISRLDGRFRVVQYDAALAEVAQSTSELSDGALTVQVSAEALGLPGDGGLRPGTLTYDAATDRLVLHLEVPGTGATTVEFVRTDVLRPLPAASPASPSPTPTSTPTPTPTPTAGTTTPSPSASADVEKDQEVVAAVGRLQAGIVAWAGDHGGLYPPVAEVAPTAGLAAYVDP